MTAMRIYRFTDTGRKITAYALYREVITGPLSYGEEIEGGRIMLENGSERKVVAIGEVDVDSPYESDKIRQAMAEMD